jgi:hypothetical protein
MTGLSSVSGSPLSLGFGLSLSLANFIGRNPALKKVVATLYFALESEKPLYIS